MSTPFTSWPSPIPDESVIVFNLAMVQLNSSKVVSTFDKQLMQTARYAASADNMNVLDMREISKVPIDVDVR